MKLTATDWAALTTLVLAAIYFGHLDDPRAWEWIKAQWARTVGAWFARRRIVSDFNTRLYKPIRIGKPDEHSKGIMVMRRDVSTGWWS